MRIVCASLWQENYQPLADITIANRKEYAEKHGFQCFFKQFSNGDPSNVYTRMAVAKVKCILEALELFPRTEYVWFADCDGLVTNMIIDVGTLADRRDQITVSSDRNGINCGSMLVGNSKQTKVLLKKVLEYMENGDKDEQIALMRLDNNWGLRAVGQLNILPQRKMNSYDYQLHENKNKWDVTGNSGQWEEGDFFIHFAGPFSVEERIKFAKKYIKGVVK